MDIITLEQGFYRYLIGTRDAFLRPLVALLEKTPITPNHISLLHVITMIVFAALAVSQSKFAVIWLLVSLSLDALDGALARARRESSPRGKFIDRLADSTALTIYVATLILAQFIPLTAGLAYLIAVFTAIALRSICNHYVEQAHQRIGTKGGEILFSNGLLYALFPLSVLFSYNLFLFVLPICFLLTGVEIVTHLLKLARCNEGNN